MFIKVNPKNFIIVVMDMFQSMNKTRVRHWGIRVIAVKNNIIADQK
jgi:hypothetical protein